MVEVVNVDWVPVLFAHPFINREVGSVRKAKRKTEGEQGEAGEERRGRRTARRGTRGWS